MKGETGGSLFSPFGVDLWIDEGNLKYRVPAGAMSPELKQLLSSNKEFLLAIIDRAAGRIRCLPQTINQESLWFLGRLAPSSTAYHIALTCKIVSRVDSEALRGAIEAQSARHAALRTTFTSLSGKASVPVQLVHERLAPEYDEVRVEERGEEALRRAVARKYGEAFRLEEGPPMRTALFTQEGGERILLIVLHHIVCDAISLRGMIEDLARDYAAVSKGSILEPSRDDEGYAEFIHRRAVFPETESGRNQERFWIDLLRGAPPSLELKSYLPRPSTPGFRGSTLKFSIAGDRYTEIADFAKARSCTVSAVLLSAFCAFLGKSASTDDVVVGMPCAARTDPADADIFGYGMNVVPIRSRIGADQSFARLCSAMMKAVAAALDSQSYPIAALASKIVAKRDVRYNPIFQAMYNYMNPRALGSLAPFLGDTGGEPSDLGGLSILPWNFNSQEGQLDLTFEVVDNGGSLGCALKYSLDILDAERAASLAEDLRAAIGAAIAMPDAIVHYRNGEAPRSAEPRSAQERKPLLIVGNFTVEPLEASVKFWIDKARLEYEAVFGPYNQIFQSLLDPSSSLARNKAGTNALFLRVYEWFEAETSVSGDEELSRKAREFVEALSEAERRCPKARFIVFLPPPPPGLEAGLRKRVGERERNLADAIRAETHAFVSDGAELLGAYAVENYYEPSGETEGHMPYTPEFYAAMGTLLARKVAAAERRPFKAIVADCDNTLWEGVVGEDGVSGIRVGPGRAFLQRFLLECRDRGMLLCLCSKNEEGDVLRALRERPDMLIRPEHVSFSRVNWKAKPDNILEMAKEMNLGLDSIIFIDDNPVECAEVAARLPEVASLRIPGADEDIPAFLRGAWIFDALSITEADRERGRQYEESRRREAFRGDATSFAEFIGALELKIDIRDLEAVDMERVSQLTMRTNQFNASGKRRSPGEIADFLASRGAYCLTARVSDRFGDYGLVGTALTAARGSELLVDTFLLSCRALGKGVEHAMLAALGERARRNGLPELVIAFAPTDRNAPARAFLESATGAAIDGPREIRLDSALAAGSCFDPREGRGAAKYENAAVDAAVDNGARAPRAEPYAEIAESLSHISGILEAIKAAGRGAGPNRGGSGGKPSTATEKAIAEAWKNATGADQIGKTDGFFDIGGTSIMMPQIAAYLAREYNLDISILDMFQYPTVSQIAAHMDSRTEGEASPIDREAALKRRKALGSASGAAMRLKKKRAKE